MTARHAREVLAQIEAASAALERAMEILDRVQIAQGFPAGSRKQGLEVQVRKADRAVAEARDTCRVVLGMEERWAVRAAQGRQEVLAL